MGSAEVSAALNSDKMIDYQHYIQKLLEAKANVLIYAGEFDA